MQGIVMLVVTVFMTIGLCANEVTVARRGAPAAYTIVLSATASASQCYAADELQTFIARITGVTLPIANDAEPLPAQAILLGETRHTAAVAGTLPELRTLGDDGFVLKTCGAHLVIFGSPVRGTLYGVYEVLERFGGCRWYASWHSVIPVRDAFRVPELDETQKPAFALREPFWYDMFNGDLAARNKANGSSMHLQDKHGGKIRFGGGLFVHTFDILCPVAEFFDTHPEYFSEVKGKRTRELTQLCLTHPDVLKIVTQRVLERIRKDPTAKLFSVSQNDWRNPCECPACKAIDEREGSHSGTIITFVNQVAEAVEKEFPGVWIETLAYQYTRTPPKQVKPRHNVVPRLCTIECDFSHTLDQSRFAENTKFVQDIRGWSALTDKLFIWDYVTNFRGYLAPFPNLNALQGNVQFFQKNKVVGLFEQGAYQGRHGEFAELKAWLLAKWLWNPALPQKPLMDDFITGYYGVAAPFVQRYIALLHGQYNDSTNKPLQIFVDVAQMKFDPTFVEAAAQLWKEAEAAVAASPAHAYNVRMSALSIGYTQLARMPKPEGIKVWCTENPRAFAPSADVHALAKKMCDGFSEAKNIRLSEGQQTHDEILASWQALALPQIPTQGVRVAIVEDTQLSLGRRGTWGDTVKDSAAEDGSAMKLYNTHYEWCTSLHVKQVAFDAGKRYKIRARLRVEKEPGKKGNAFWAGVYDTKAKKDAGSVVRTTDAVAEQYAWYDIAEFVPNSDQYFWIGPGTFNKANNETSAIQALYIDKLEWSRID